MSAPDGKPDDGSPKFGRLLIALVLAVLLIVGITFGSEAWLGHP
ncbi:MULTISPECIES: hypothetical protein [Massilia]|nr:MULTISPECIES: hypothetical protein [Massilia]